MRTLLVPCSVYARGGRPAPYLRGAATAHAGRSSTASDAPAAAPYDAASAPSSSGPQATDDSALVGVYDIAQPARPPTRRSLNTEAAWSTTHDERHPSQSPSQRSRRTARPYPPGTRRTDPPGATITHVTDGPRLSTMHPLMRWRTRSWSSLHAMHSSMLRRRPHCIIS